MFNNTSYSPLIMVSHQHSQLQPQLQHNLKQQQDNHYHHQHHYPNHQYYFRQPQTIEIIALEEVPPPSRHSGPCSSSAASSSYYSSSSEEEESVSSYCSSDLPSVHHKAFPTSAEPQHNQRQSQFVSNSTSRVDDSHSSRMRRVEQWRNQYAKAVGAQLVPSTIGPKRKGVEAENDEDDDTRSRTSKRSRPATSISTSVRSVHSCSACDACFDSQQSLRRHGRGPRANEACRAAVEYGFE